MHPFSAKTFDTDRSLKKHLPLFVCAALAAYALAFLFRALEYPNWQAFAPKVDGEFVLATHDAYCWLAGAKGFGPSTGHPMAWLANALSALTGMSLLQVGFWGPAILAGLVAVFALGWGWLLFGRAGGLAASIIAPLGFGFLYRSRLGYFDTDPFVLAMPLAMCLLLALLLAPLVRSDWLPGHGEGEHAEADWLDESDVPWAALGFGIVSRFGGIWHPDIIMFNFGIALFAAALGLFIARPGRRGVILMTLGIYIAAAISGSYQSLQIGRALAGIGFAVAVCAAYRTAMRGRMAAGWHLPAGVLVLVAAVVLSGMGGWLAGYYQKLLFWTGAVPHASTAELADGKAAVFPNILASVIEAGKIDIGLMLFRFSTNIATTVLGLAGLVGIVAVRPLAVLLLPLLILGLLSPVFGARFSMFPVPVVAIGLGGGIWMMVQWLFAREGKVPLRYHIAAQLLVAVLVALPAIYWLRIVSPSPVLTASHARGLIALRDQVPENAAVWTWWDWGYATQFYAECESPIDGAQHDGADIYPAAVAFTCDSPQLAANVLKYSTQPVGSRGDSVWRKLSVEDCRELMMRLARGDVSVEAPRPVYLVVPFQNLRILGWISYYGRWNVETGTSDRGQVEILPKPYSADFTNGTVQFSDGSSFALKSIDILRKDGPLSRDYPDNSGPCLILNETAGMAVLMEESLYHSNMVQLMLRGLGSDPATGPFKLVYSDFPNMAVYRVR